MPSWVVCPSKRDVDRAVGLVLAGRAEHLDAARRERLRPARGVEARVVGAEHAEQRLARDGVGQQPEVLRRRPRRVREVRDAQVGPQLAQHPGRQGEVIVLDQHPRALAQRPRRAPRRTRRCRTGRTPTPGGSSRRRPGAVGVAKSRWCTNHSVELATTLYARWNVAGSMSSIRTAVPSVSCPSRSSRPPGCAPGGRAGRRRTAPRRPRRCRRRRPCSSARTPGPPPPRLASSEPSSRSLKDSGPRLDATSSRARASLSHTSDLPALAARLSNSVDSLTAWNPVSRAPVGG